MCSAGKGYKFHLYDRYVTHDGTATATEVECLSDQWSTSSLFFVSLLSAPLKLQVLISAGSQLSLIHKAKIWAKS